MKQYKHWLKIDWRGGKKEHEEIQKYIKRYPNTKIELWLSNTDIFTSYFCLTCYQEYNELDMDVNTGSNSLRRLERKPNNLFIPKISVTDYLNMKTVKGEVY